ncbi:hypothetical protein N9C85_00815 [Synechococcus sp. AH-224-I15]|nr:hypothetical protein [Synechococcus sp. AH-224-I15]
MRCAGPEVTLSRCSRTGPVGRCRCLHHAGGAVLKYPGPADQRPLGRVMQAGVLLREVELLPAVAVGINVFCDGL